MALPGERRTQILQALAEMLEQPRAGRITTAALARRLQVSEAALYRHFASKAQMYEGLIAFIETTLFGLINQIAATSADGLTQARQIIGVLLSFPEKNRGMTRVLTGDALVTEDDRLQERINQVVDRVEASLRQALRNAVSDGGLPPQEAVAARASLLVHLVLGHWLRYAQTGWRIAPTEHMAAQLAIALPGEPLNPALS